VWSTPSYGRSTRTTSRHKAVHVSILTPTTPDPPAVGKDKGSPRAALCRFRFPTRSAHVEHFLMEMPVHIKALTGEVFAQGSTESGRAAEPDARLPPVGYGGAYAFAGQVAVAAADQQVQLDLRAADILCQSGQRLLVDLRGAVEEVHRAG